MKMIKLLPIGIILILTSIFVREKKNISPSEPIRISQTVQPPHTDFVPRQSSVVVNVSPILPIESKILTNPLTLEASMKSEISSAHELIESNKQNNSLPSQSIILADTPLSPHPCELNQQLDIVLQPLEIKQSPESLPSQPIAIADTSAEIVKYTQNLESLMQHESLIADTCCPESCPEPAPCPEPCPPPPCQPCPPPDPCAKCAQLWPSCGPDWIITPNAGPCVTSGADLFFTGEFIYWTIREDHLAFAFSTPEVVNPFVVPEGKGSVFHPDWDFHPGFKVGLGILFDHDGWDLYANYTWMRAKNNRGKTSLKPGFIIRDFEWGRVSQSQDDNERIQNIQGQWDLDSFNVIDLELARNFFVSSCLQLRPHFGLKGTWQEQKFSVNNNTLNSINAEESTNSSHNKMSYWGIGIRTGLDSSWHFSRCFSFFGEIAVSALWEHFEIDAKVLENNVSLGIVSGFLNTENTFHTIKPILELYTGLRFETWFCCDEFHFSLEAGWEEQWWSDQNQFFSFSSETRLGDLVLQGLTVKLRFDF